VTEHWRAAVQRKAHVAEPPRQATQQEWEQVQVRGSITYLEAGPAEAVPVVFLHGIGGGARSFLPQLDGLRGACRAIAWDMPGHGGSTPLELVGVDSLTAALAGFLRELGLDRPVLVGHSLGGMLVQRLLSLQPQAARAAVLAQTSAAFGSRDPAWAAEFIQTRLGPLDAGHGMAELAAGMVADLAGDDPDPDGMALARECLAGTPDSTYRDTVMALPGFDLREALPRLAVPVLVLAGTRDPNAPASAMERMASRIPGARYAALDGAGHLAHLERPAAFNAALLEFLSGLP
jgi:3-oxoadipate enol-lactonase